MILQEKNYETQMNEVVLPFLNGCREVLSLEREKGHVIHCMRYQAKEPRGVVLVSHGFTESEEKYREFLYYFLQWGYTVYMPEHCGHGFSYRLNEDLSLVHVDSYQRYVKDLLYTASVARGREGSLPLFLYGHSMGGGIAAAAASRAPELFSRVILSSPMIRPLSGGIPWPVTLLITAAQCLLGHERDYVMGAHGYDGSERFEDSAGLSRVRFDRYHKRQNEEVHYQTCAASYGWLREAARLSYYLLGPAPRSITMPLLLFQADNDMLVSNEAQNEFIKKLIENGNDEVLIRRIPGSRHEIFNSYDVITKSYWDQVKSFLEGKPL